MRFLAKLDPEFYCSTYCNHPHDFLTGMPIDHECIVIPPEALDAERAGDFDEAIRILAEVDDA